MNQRIPRIGAVIVTAAVVLFAICMIVNFPFGSYLVCMFLPIGYIMMAAGFQHECPEERRVSANVGMTFSAIYAALIFLVYFAQTTTVRLESLDEQAIKILDFQRGGLLFNYDLLGYGLMALSTFFIGLSMKAESRADKGLKCLMMLHGVFFLSCFIMPMTGVFMSMADGEGSSGSTDSTALLVRVLLAHRYLVDSAFWKRKAVIRFPDEYKNTPPCGFCREAHFWFISCLSEWSFGW